MAQLFEPGQKIQIEEMGAECRVDRLLGAGGQGEVYLVDLNGNPMALKWYYSIAATTQQYEALTRLVERGAPTNEFIWPIGIATCANLDNFGYVMPLRPEGYYEAWDLLAGKIAPTLRTLATVGYGLASNFLALHAQGLCYRDISPGNVFLNPDTGAVLICDNDNVAVDGDTNSGVAGTQKFMAPEILCAQTMPSAKTDRYSLAVLLFYLLLASHPLEGLRESAHGCLTPDAITQIYGCDPLFIFDPDDASNRPDPDWHANALACWSIYPKFLRDRFTQAFTVGLRKSQSRVVDFTWKEDMIRLRDSILYCSCGTHNFYDADALIASRGVPGLCWACQGQLTLPPRIRIGNQIAGRVIMLNSDTVLYAHHTDTTRMWDFSTPTAKVVRHPTIPDLWGLENLTRNVWNCIAPDGQSTQILPGKRIALAPGTKINFGNTEGELRK